MSYKIGLILSMLFVALFFLFGADLISIQSAYSLLDAKANNISYVISRTGVIDESFIEYIESSYGVDLEIALNPAPTFGETVTYTISTEYQPLVIDKNTITISISRLTIIGFYG